MNLYFGKVDLNEFDTVNPAELFQDGNNYYWYMAEIDEDQICFRDTCGRHFPVALEHVKEADIAMFAASELFTAQRQSEKIMKRARTRIAELVNYWEKQDE